MLKYVVSYNTKFGTISAESKKPQDLVEAYAELKKVAVRLENNSLAGNTPKLSLKAGSGETTKILKAVESELLTTNFFEKPRTTGETRDKLARVADRQFTSRKVSQALGILRDRKVLRRTGRRNFFKYTTS